MTTISPARAQTGYALADDEGEAFWLLGMLQTIKIGREDTDGAYGLAEILVPAGVGSPWHVHPEEDEWFYVLEGEITFWVADTQTVADGRLVRVRTQGGAAHLLRGGRWREGAGRVRADAIRGIPTRGRTARPRTRAAAASRRPPRHGPADPDREAKRVRDPRTPRAAPRALAHHDHERARTPHQRACLRPSSRRDRSTHDQCEDHTHRQRPLTGRRPRHRHRRRRNRIRHLRPDHDLPLPLRQLRTRNRSATEPTKHCPSRPPTEPQACPPPSSRPNGSELEAAPPSDRPIRRLAMTPEAAIAVVESFWEEVWAACNPSAVDRFVTEDFVITSAGVDIAGRENFKAWVGNFQSKDRRPEMETHRDLCQRRRLARVVALPRHRPQQRHVRVAGGWQADRVHRQRHPGCHAHRQARPQLDRAQRLGALQPANGLAVTSRFGVRSHSGSRDCANVGACASPSPNA